MSDTRLLETYTYGVILKEREGEDDDKYNIIFDGRPVILSNNIFEFHHTDKLNMNNLFDKLKGTQNIDSVYFFTSDGQKVILKIAEE